MLKQRLRFYLALFFKRFQSRLRCHYFLHKWERTVLGRGFFYNRCFNCDRSFYKFSFLFFSDCCPAFSPGRLCWIYWAVLSRASILSSFSFLFLNRACLKSRSPFGVVLGYSRARLVFRMLSNSQSWPTFGVVLGNFWALLTHL